MSDLSTHRIVHLPLPREVQPAAWALCRHSKDIYNTTLNLIRQAIAVYSWDRQEQVYRRKEDREMSTREAEAMATWDRELLRLNTAWEASHQQAVIEWEKEQQHPAITEGRLTHENEETAGEPADDSGRAKKSNKAPKRLVLPVLSQVVQKGELWTILLNSSLLLAVVMATPDLLLGHLTHIQEKDRTAFRTLPAKMAEASVFLAQLNIKSYLANLKAWLQDRGSRPEPQLPKYLPQTAGLICTSSGASIGSRLSSIKKCALWLDADHTQPLSEDDRAAYALFAFRQVAEEAIAKRWAGSRCPQSLRQPTWEDLAQVQLVPQKNRTVSLRIVIKAEITYPETSFLGQVVRRHPKEWADHAKPAAKQLWLNTVLREQSWGSSTAAAQSASQCASQSPTPFEWVSQTYGVGGVDLGLNNLATIAWSNGAPADIITGKQIEKGLDAFDRSIGTWVSKHMTQEHKDLIREQHCWNQTQKTLEEEKRSKFSQDKAQQIKICAQLLHQSPPLLRMRTNRANWLHDKIHQITAKIACWAVEKNVACLIVGQNKGWKDGINLRTRENHRFCRIPHARIIELLRQKLELVGIALVLTEESYTSQASFIDHDPLHRATTDQVEDLEDDIAEIRSTSKHTIADQEEHLAHRAKNPFKKTKKSTRSKRDASEPCADRAENVSKDVKVSPIVVARHGYRDKKNRHRFVRQVPWLSDSKRAKRQNASKSLLQGPVVIHADVNGAFNMIRKVCCHFRWHQGLVMNHQIWQMSWREGVRRLKLPSLAETKT